MKDRLTILGRDKAKAEKNPWHTSSESDWPTGSALLHKSGDCQSFPYPKTDLAYRFCGRYAKRGIAIKHSDADLDFRDS
ncbi:MAG: hypothetical protein ABJG55_08810, partial [Paracoccaceae bacterium]